MRSIRVRLLVLLLTGLAVVLVAGGGAVYWIARASLQRQLDAELAAQARALASLVVFDDGDLEFEFDQGLTVPVTDGYFEFRTRLGRVLRRSENLDDDALPTREPASRDYLFEDVTLPGGVRGRAVWLAFRPRLDFEYAPDRPDELVVSVAIDRGPTDSAMATLLGALIIVGGVVAATVAVLVTVGVRWGLVPLDRLSRQLCTIGDRTMSKRFEDARAPRELVPVYRELNRMLDRVEVTLERERSFANAAAHELRTPLAELRSTAEVAIRWPDSDRAANALQELLGVGREMERLVESLLLISRGNAADVDGEADEVPLKTLVDSCLDRANGSISEKDLELTVDLDDGDTLHAPHDALEIILRNLIDNAVHYTPLRGSITIRQSGNGRSRALLVENGPVDLVEDDLPRLFEPFWRFEHARSDRKHVGLGLTVVHRIARAVGLEIDAGLEGDQLQMRVTAPS
ncbi:MAG: sensor histidine kinase [Planctomycetota bacterium]|jgi:signal transduction histidine kinase